MDHIHLTFDPLEISKVNGLVADDGCGAISYFVGTTRDNFESKKVVSLEYEAYEPMALKEMHAICKELRCRWPDIVNIAIYHRLGLVNVREASVIIAISSPHRQTALDATAEAIEALKRRVPIWKKEKYCDDESAWKENKEYPVHKKSKKALNFSTCAISNIKNVASNLVQISAPEIEIERRIESFVRNKREEINLSNALDFSCSPVMPTEEESIEDKTSCARTDSILIKQEQTSKGHLRVRNAARINTGPQIRRPDYLKAIERHMATMQQKHCRNNNTKFASINERFDTIETFLGLSSSDSLSIHQRLKEIENRIIYLETISPEYKHFMNGFFNELPMPKNEAISKELDTKPISAFANQRTYSIAQIDALIRGYEIEN